MRKIYLMIAAAVLATLMPMTALATDGEVSGAATDYEVVEATAEPIAAATAKPKFEFGTDDETSAPAVTAEPIDMSATNTQAPAVPVAPLATGAPSATEAADASKTIVKTCEEDIPVGEYLVTGEGVLRIVSLDGQIQDEAEITATPASDEQVASKLVNLKKGDVLVMTPVNGAEKSRLKFNKVEEEAPIANKATVAPIKTNPKTGDSSMAVVIGVVALAVIAFVTLEILKRKKNNN